MWILSTHIKINIGIKKQLQFTISQDEVEIL